MLRTVWAPPDLRVLVDQRVELILLQFEHIFDARGVEPIQRLIEVTLVEIRLLLWLQKDSNDLLASILVHALVDY